MPLRQTTGFVESLLELVGLDWRVPDFSALCQPRPGSRNAVSMRGAKDVVRCYSIPRIGGAAAPLDPFSWLVSKPLPGSGQHWHQG
ncbi:hypothetical protein OAN307_c40760 [Octadecabacter antarcticus 307]|uniref:Transposase DDE domain-containing protein n=1 Tax=Octadecabacter antarcticus 307 TaxID=391626 RepID=M9RBF2_9RHOB|nr:hypothetical protein OAN307_c40760 [Octadecabacter antarcticus 307]